MKHRTLCAALIAGLSLGLAAGLRADAGADQLTLKDGRVISGQVTEESGDTITMQVNGVTRRYKRDLVKRVLYGSGPATSDSMASAPVAEAPSAPPVAEREPEPRQDAEAVAPVQPAPASVPAASLDEDIARRYQVPLTEVRWVRRQGIRESDLPIVFFVAASAGITPGPVVRLRLSGWSWKEIEHHYGMDPERVRFEPGPWVAYPFLLGAEIIGGGWGWRGGGGWRGGYGGGWGWHHR